MDDKIANSLAEAEAAYFNRRVRPSVPVAFDEAPSSAEPPKGTGGGIGPVAIGSLGKEAYDFVQQPGPRRETQSWLQSVGDTLGWTTLGLAGTAAAAPVTAPVAAPAAALTGATSAGLYIGEGLVEMAGGDKVRGAEQVALGLVDAATPAFKLGAHYGQLKKGGPPVLQKYVPPAVAAAGRLARELGINVAQDELRSEIDNPAVVYMLP